MDNGVNAMIKNLRDPKKLKWDFAVLYIKGMQQTLQVRSGRKYRIEDDCIIIEATTMASPWPGQDGQPAELIVVINYDDLARVDFFHHPLPPITPTREQIDEAVSAIVDTHGAPLTPDRKIVPPPGFSAPNPEEEK